MCWSFQVRSSRGMWVKTKRSKVYPAVLQPEWGKPWIGIICTFNYVCWHVVKLLSCLYTGLLGVLQVDEARDILATVVLAHVPVCPLHASPNHGHPLHCQCYWGCSWEPCLWGWFWSLLDCQAVSPSILILSRWLSVAKDWCVYPCMVSGSRYIISWLDAGLANPCRVPT